MCRAELSRVIAKLNLSVLEAGGSGREELELASRILYCPVTRECSVRHNPDRKNMENYLQINVR